MKIFYRPEQTATKNNSVSPSAQKPALVVERFLKLDADAEVVSFEPLTRDDIVLAHDHRYVDGVLKLTRDNGFGNRMPEIADTLPYTTGSFYAAAHHALTTKESCVSPTSGFHHAGYDYGGGFCSFNGLMIAAVKLLRAKLCKKIGILDLDNHYGNGTEDICEELKLSKREIMHYTFGGENVTKKNAAHWLADLPRVVATFKDCDVVLYQAGADPHVDDPFGGSLTTEQLAKRDCIVFEGLKYLGVPVAWNLAGGYQKPMDKVLEIHENTAMAFLGTMNL